MKHPYLLVAFAALLLVVNVGNGLECFTGYSMVRGRPVGTSREVCKKSSDQCYKASAELNTLTKLKLAGCSTLRCKASSNKCSGHNIAGQHYELCCCSTDLCNTKDHIQSSNNNGTHGRGAVGGIINKLKNTVQGQRN